MSYPSTVRAGVATVDVTHIEHAFGAAAIDILDIDDGFGDVQIDVRIIDGGSRAVLIDVRYIGECAQTLKRASPINIHDFRIDVS